MPFTPGQRPTIHYTQLPDMKEGSVLLPEWNFYRREVARLLAEGYAGKFIVVKGETIIGPYETYDEASLAAHTRYPLQPFMIQEVLEYSPVYRVPWAG
jgi:hypothetical protein